MNKTIVTALIALALPASASARIVPQHGIAGANLDVTQAQLRAKVGNPDKVASPTSPIFGKYTTWFYGGTSVDMFRTGDRKSAARSADPEIAAGAAMCGERGPGRDRHL